MKTLILATLLLSTANVHAGTQANLTCSGIIGNGFNSYKYEHKTYGKKTVTISYKCDHKKDKYQTYCTLIINGEEYMGGQVVQSHWGRNLISDIGNISIDPKTKELDLLLRDGNNHTQRWLTANCTEIK